MVWNIFMWAFVIECLDKTFGASINEKQSNILIQEVSFGQTAEVNCRSNDENYIFDYWILDNNKIVGPTSKEYDNVKFDYEVLSGKLVIRAASNKDEGIYTCVSREVNGNGKKIEKVKILIARDWEDVYEHDSNINMIRILIILITLALLGIGGYVVFRMWKDRYRYPNYLEQDDEESAEEVFNRSPSTSAFKILRSPGKIILGSNDSNSFTDSSNNTGTDFKSILEKSSD